MSDNRFDELSKALARTTTRRQAVKVFGVTAFAGALSLVGARGAEAQGRCKKNGSPCRRVLLVLLPTRDRSVRLSAGCADLPEAAWPADRTMRVLRVEPGPEPRHV